MIRVDNLTLRLGSFSLTDVSFDIPSGKYGVLMGKTGCGKTSLLEAIAGLKPIESGRIILGQTDVTELKPAERNIGLVPQDGALFSTMTVRDQLAFALIVRRGATRPSRPTSVRACRDARDWGSSQALSRGSQWWGTATSCSGSRPSIPAHDPLSRRATERS